MRANANLPPANNPTLPGSSVAFSSSAAGAAAAAGACDHRAPMGNVLAQEGVGLGSRKHRSARTRAP